MQCWGVGWGVILTKLVKILEKVSHNFYVQQANNQV